jgi:hypothetical protein
MTRSIRRLNLVQHARLRNDDKVRVEAPHLTRRSLFGSVCLEPI